MAAAATSSRCWGLHRALQHPSPTPGARAAAAGSRCRTCPQSQGSAGPSPPARLARRTRARVPKSCMNAFVHPTACPPRAGLGCRLRYEPYDGHPIGGDSARPAIVPSLHLPSAVQNGAGRAKAPRDERGCRPDVCARHERCSGPGRTERDPPDNGGAPVKSPALPTQVRILSLPQFAKLIRACPRQPMARDRPPRGFAHPGRQGTPNPPG
jgi:hypothetical protein